MKYILFTIFYNKSYTESSAMFVTQTEFLDEDSADRARTYLKTKPGVRDCYIITVE